MGCRRGLAILLDRNFRWASRWFRGGRQAWKVVEGGCNQRMELGSENHQEPTARSWGWKELVPDEDLKFKQAIAGAV